MTNESFIFSDFLKRYSRLRASLEDILRNSEDELAHSLLDDMPADFDQIDDLEEAPLSLAFVGQYDAGKTTIVSALTGRKDLPIDGNVCTDKVTAYNWHGVRLLDTPGIHAGYPDHDRLTYNAIDRADLLVFVITNELFDDKIGAHFRELAFKRQKVGELMLVVNKMGNDPGDPEIKIPDIEEVTYPLKVQDLRTSFIDALAYLDAQETTLDDERSELLEIAQFDTFVQKLNTFIRTTGILGRLTTPLYELESVAKQARGYTGIDHSAERMTLELLRREKRLYHASKARLRQTLKGDLSQAASDITRYGDEIAEALSGEKSQEEVEAINNEADNKAKKRCDRLAEQADKLFAEEMATLEEELNDLQESPLREQLNKLIASTEREESEWREPSFSGASEWGGYDGPGQTEWTERAREANNQAIEIGKRLAAFASGPAAKGGQLLGAKGAAGSGAHKAVYKLGKAFGHKFKPWGAANVAKHIGNLGRVIAIAGPIIAIVIQITEDRRKKEHQRQLREARDKIRLSYRNAVREVRNRFWESFDDLVEAYYVPQIQAINDQIDTLVNQREERSTASEELQRIQSDIMSLIEEVHSQSARALAKQSSVPPDPPKADSTA